MSAVSMTMVYIITGLRLNMMSAVSTYVSCVGYITLGETMVLIFSTLMPYEGLALIASMSLVRLLYPSFLFVCVFRVDAVF